MASVYQEVELSWGGETYRVTPTYAMVQRIEQKVSIAGMSARIAEGEPPMSHIAYVVAYLLKQAGARDVTPEDVYDVMCNDMTPDQFGHFAAVVISGFVPQREQSGGNSAAGTGTPSNGGTRTGKRKSTGRSTTR